MIFFAFSLNLIYQFWVHTETIPKLWRPVELVLNTPSHHRVHHASDAKYLDRNYGGILIVWDRLFGTFAEEDERPTYGLTHPVTTFNPFRLQYGEFVAMLHQVRSAKGWRERLGYVFAPPGWSPGSR
jgi:sterol desaturase/sphingolipid hydroxylase (fatty acid hydroxylase superfamily)